MHVCDMYVIFFLLISIEFQWLLLLLLFAYSALPTRNLKSMCEKVHCNAHFNDNVPIYVLFRLVLTRIFAVTYIYSRVFSLFADNFLWFCCIFPPLSNDMNEYTKYEHAQLILKSGRASHRSIHLLRAIILYARLLARSFTQRERVTNTHRAHHPIVSCNACLLILIANIRQL